MRAWPSGSPTRTGGCWARCSEATKADAADAAAAAKAAAPAWRELPFDERAAVFLKAAELLSGPWRSTLNAATMLGQSKTAYQAEIDSACELIDFWRFNVHFAEQILSEQPPLNGKGVWNRMDHRPLEGFVYAITPFNFTAIAGNLPTAPALMGNTVVWKPAPTQTLAAYFTMRLLEAAGLPPGVINLVTGTGIAVSDVLLDDPDLAGIHFTGSTAVFQKLWSIVGANIADYRSYPRIVGETGGKDFILAHPSADPDVLRTAMVRGAFEYQGQKCSAASRAYVPQSIWRQLKSDLADVTNSLAMGPVTDLSNFMGAVIDDRAFAKHAAAIDRAHASSSISVVAGGTYDDSEGYFVRPTVLQCTDPEDQVFTTEYFGPILSVYAYPDRSYDRVVDQLEAVAPYALTGSVIAQDRQAINDASQRLRYAAGQLLRQRQADRCGCRTATVRWSAGIRDQRQGRCGAEPPALDEHAVDQGDLRAGGRPHLPAHGSCPVTLTRAHEDAVDELTTALPEGTVVVDRDVVAAYRSDRAETVAAGWPMVLVRATSTADVQATMRVAAAHGIPVVPRGAGSGLAGGASAVDGCILLSLERMRDIHIDPQGMYAVVQPGLMNAEVKQAARRHGLWYPPDPSSYEFCSIGGNLATNAGGLCCVKYGVTTDYVLALEVVLADGRAVRLGGRTIKDVAGYDLKRLFVGSEGTLGVITEATLRLRPLPPSACTMVATFEDVADAGRTVSAIMAVTRPATLEMMDRTTVRAVESYRTDGPGHRGRRHAHRAERQRRRALGSEEIAAMERTATANGATFVATTDDPDEGEMFLEARRLSFSALFDLGTPLIEDVGVPIDRIAELVHGVELIAAEHDTLIATVGHAGDGNFHPFISFDGTDPAAVRRAERAFADVIALALELGGTITGEHGVGVVKSPYLVDQVGPDVLQLSRQIKALLDPQGILNPGKML